MRTDNRDKPLTRENVPENIPRFWSTRFFLLWNFPSKYEYTMRIQTRLVRMGQILGRVKNFVRGRRYFFNGTVYQGSRLRERKFVNFETHRFETSRFPGPEANRSCARDRSPLCFRASYLSQLIVRGVSSMLGSNDACTISIAVPARDRVISSLVTSRYFIRSYIRGPLSLPFRCSSLRWQKRVPR